MRFTDPVRSALLGGLIAGAMVAPGAATHAGPAITLNDLQSGETRSVAAVDLGQNLPAGTRVSVRLHNGRSLEIIVEEVVVSSDRPKPLSMVAGVYRSEITSNSHWYFRRPAEQNLSLTFRAEGDKLVGSNKKLDFRLIGELEGDTIRFYSLPGPVSFYEITGTWKINADGSILNGRWQVIHHDASGEWNLTRVVAGKTPSPTAAMHLRGRQPGDHSPVTIRLDDIVEISIPAQRAEAPSEDSEPAAPVYCQADAAARDALDAAWDAWRQAGDAAATVYDLLQQAEAAAEAPECDSVRARILAHKAIELASNSNASSSAQEASPPDPAPERIPLGSLRQPGPYFQWLALSSARFEEPQFSGSYVSLAGFDFGYAFDPRYAIGYQANFSFLITPSLDDESTLEAGDEPKLSAQLLYLQRYWPLSDSLTGYALLGFSRVELEIEAIETNCFILCTFETSTTYRNNESGHAWGLGLEWGLGNGGQASLEYINYARDDFEYDSIHFGVSQRF